MNHKLQNTILASAVVGTALLFGLLAAEPLDRGRASDRPTLQYAGHTAGKRLAADLQRDLARDFEMQARALEAELATGSAADALVLASAVVASSMVEATLGSMLDDMGSRPAPARAIAAGQPDAAPARRRGRLATPYFSSPHGLRRGSRE